MKLKSKDLLLWVVAISALVLSLFAVWGPQLQGLNSFADSTITFSSPPEGAQAGFGKNLLIEWSPPDTAGVFLINACTSNCDYYHMPGFKLTPWGAALAQGKLCVLMPTRAQLPVFYANTNANGFYAPGYGPSGPEVQILLRLLGSGGSKGGYAVSDVFTLTEDGHDIGCSDGKSPIRPASSNSRFQFLNSFLSGDLVISIPVGISSWLGFRR